MVQRTIHAYGADTIIRTGLAADPRYMESVLRNLPPGVQVALQKASAMLLEQQGEQGIGTDAAFMTGAAVAVAILHAEDVVEQVEDFFS